MSNKLKLNREQRDSLYAQTTRMVLAETGFDIADLSLEEIADLKDALSLLDQIGWQRDDARHEAEVEVTEPVVRALHGLEDYALDGLEEARRDLLAPPDPEWSEVSEQDAREAVDWFLDDLTVCRGVAVTADERRG